MTTSLRRTLTQPRWILAVAVGLLFTGLFVRLGIWQLDRLEERRATNAIIEDRRASETRPFDALVGQYGIDADILSHRPAVVTGTFVTDAEIFSIGRTEGDNHGTLIATPLELSDGSWMIVVRGLVPSDTPGPPAASYAPPTGIVEVFGHLDDGESPLPIGEPDPDGGIVTSVARIDLEYLDKWMGPKVLPVSLVADDRGTDASRAPIPLTPVELTEGRHLGYAVQWFAFAAIVVVGVAALIWRASTSQDVVSEIGEA